MSPAAEHELRERVRALEVKVEHLAEALENRNEKIDEMYAVLMQARGARWLLLAAAALAGGLASFGAKFLPFFNSLPR